MKILMQNIDLKFTYPFLCATLLVDLHQEMHWVMAPCKLSASLSLGVVCQNKYAQQQRSQSYQTNYYCIDKSWTFMKETFYIYFLKDAKTNINGYFHCQRKKAYTKDPQLFAQQMGLFVPRKIIYPGNDPTEEIIFCSRKPEKFKLLSSAKDLNAVIQCKSGELVSKALRCDGKSDCISGDDEHNCICDTAQITVIPEHTCAMVCHAKRCKCTQLYFSHQGSNFCHIYTKGILAGMFENAERQKIKTISSVCSNGHHTECQYTNDLVLDCPDGVDEIPLNNRPTLKSSMQNYDDSPVLFPLLSWTQPILCVSCTLCFQIRQQQTTYVLCAWRAFKGL